MPKKPTSIIAKFLIWRYKHISEKNFIFILSALIGLLAGLGAVTLKNLTHYIQHFLESNLIRTIHQAYYFVFPIVGIFIVAVFIKYIIKRKVSHGVPSTLYAISRLKAIMPSYQTWGYLLAGPITVGFGGSVGLEGPAIVTGSAIGSNTARFFHLNQSKRTLLLGAGAAGALASIFQAPIAGIVFALEIFSLDLTIGSILPMLIASITAILTSYFFLGDDILIHFHPTVLFNFKDIPFFILLGGVSALISIYFNKTFYLMTNFSSKISNPYKKLLIGGAILGLIVYLVPPLYGEGYDIVNNILTGNIHNVVITNIFHSANSNVWIIIALLIGLVIFKVIAMSLTFAAGGIGGIFAPTLFVGSIAGFAFAMIINNSGLFSYQLSNVDFALVGMAGLMAGILHAPLTSIFLISEITGGYELFVPLMITSSISYLIVKRFMPFGIYATELAKKGDLITHDKDKTVLSMMDLNKIIEKNFIAVHPSMTLGEMLTKAVTKSKRNIFPVVEDNGEFLGIILLDDIRDIMFNTKLHNTTYVSNFMHEAPEVIYYNKDNMSTIMRKFQDSSAWNLPVIKEGKYYGFISKSKMLTVYRRKLIEFSV